MENKPKKSKALIITIIIIILLLLAALFFIFQNRSSSDVKTSSGLAKIFSSLIPSKNETGLKTVAQAGEDLNKGDCVSVFGTGTDNNPIVVKSITCDSSSFGTANENISSGNSGEILAVQKSGNNGFWSSISNFVGNVFKKNTNTPISPIPPVGPITPTYECTKDGVVVDCKTLPPNPDPIKYECKKDGVVVDCKILPPTPPVYECKKEGVVVDCKTLPPNPDPIKYECKKDGVIIDCEVVPPVPSIYPSVTLTATPSTVVKNGTSTITWTSTGAKECELSGDGITWTGKETENTTGVTTEPLTTSTTYTVTCTGENGLESSGNAFVEVEGSKIPDLVAGRVTPNTAVINTPTELSSVIRNIGNNTTGKVFPNYFTIKNTDNNQSSSKSLPTTSPIAAKSEITIKTTETFTVLGNYSITVCADKSTTSFLNPTNNNGLITESKEDNNCSDPVEFKVTDGPNPNLYPTVTVTAFPTSIKKGGTAGIKWTSTNATSCRINNTPVIEGSAQCSDGIDNDLNGLKDALDSSCLLKGVYVPTRSEFYGQESTKGSFSTGPLETSKSYTVMCTGTGGETSGNATVTVGGVSGNLPSVKVIASPASIAKGESSTIKWVSVYSTSCSINNIPVIEGRAQCSDGIDNDLDGLKDANDPDCLLNGKYVPTRSEFYGQESTKGSFSTGPLETSKSYTIMCTGSGGNAGGNASVMVGRDMLPDLIASKVTPTNIIKDTPTNISSIITNRGNGSTGSDFSTFFTINKNNTNQDLVTTLTTTNPALERGIGDVAVISYTFDTIGEYLVRACADKSSATDEGKISESDEGNNCGEWTIVTVSNPLPRPCSTGELLDTTVTPNICIPRGNCASPKVINGDKCENPTLCLLPKITRTSDGACINPSECRSPQVINGNNCEGPTVPVNKCLLIEQNPLTFTQDEKARLAVLLRKFYLISSTLKTADDITTIYNEIDQQKNFVTQVEELTTQCYNQIDSMPEMKAWSLLDTRTGLWKRHGNPWYTEKTGGSFPYTDENSGYMNDGNSTERILNIW